MSRIKQMIVLNATALVLVLTVAGGAAAKPRAPVKAPASAAGVAAVQQRGAEAIDLLNATLLSRQAGTAGVADTELLALTYKHRCYLFFTCTREATEAMPVGVRG